MEVLPNSPGIYQIVNLVTEHRYIGYSNNILHRRNQHVHELEKNGHGNSYLQNAWTKYGRANFSFRVLELCDEADLAMKEDYWVKILKTENRFYGYNLKPTDPNGKSNHSIETREKLSKANEGKKPSAQCIEASRVASRIQMTKEFKQMLYDSRSHIDFKQLHREKRGKPIMDTQTGEVFNSLAELCERVGVTKGSMSRILLGKRKNHTNYKYI